MIVRELVSRLSFKADNRGAEKHESALIKVRRAATALTAAYAATIGAAGTLAIRLAGTTNAVAKSAAEAGLAGDEYQRLSFALGQVSQVSQQETDRALGRLAQRIGRAQREGGKYADALLDMGFSQEQVASGAIGTSEAMDALTTRISQASSAQEASAIAGDILGTRIGRRLGPALYANAEAFREQQRRADELGGGWSELALGAGENLTDSMAEAGLITTSLTSLLAEKLIPATDAVVSRMVDWFAANRDLIMQNVRHYLEVLGHVITTVGRVLGTAARAVDTIVNAMGGWERVIRLLMAAIAGFIALKMAGWLWAVAGALGAAAGSGRLLRTVLLAISRIPIIAFLTGIALAIEDLIVWIRGGDSMLGRWLGTWEDFKETAGRVIGAVMDFLEPFTRMLEGVGEALVGAFTLDGRQVLSGLKKTGQAMIDWALQLSGLLRDALLSMLPDWLIRGIETGAGWATKAFGAVGDTASAAVGGARDLIGLGRDQDQDQDDYPAISAPGMMPTPEESREVINRNVTETSTNTRNISVNARIDSTLQVPAGTSEEQKQALRGEAERTFNELFERELNRTLTDYPVVD